MSRPKMQFSFTPADAVPRRPDPVEPPPFPPLFGRHVMLRPVTPDDYGMLQMLESAGEIGARWRYRGQTMSPEQWVGSLWSGVLAQFLVIPKGGTMPLGLVRLYRASFQDGHAYLGAVRFDLSSPSALMMRGIALAINYAFGCWSFRKLYMESPAYNVPQFASGIGRFFEIEGCMKDHFEYGGELWDMIILTIDRDDWAREGARVVRSETQPERREVRIRGMAPA